MKKPEINLGFPQEFSQHKATGMYWVRNEKHTGHSVISSYWKSRNILRILCNCGESVEMHRSDLQDCTVVD